MGRRRRHCPWPRSGAVVHIPPALRQRERSRLEISDHKTRVAACSGFVSPRNGKKPACAIKTSQMSFFTGWNDISCILTRCRPRSKCTDFRTHFRGNQGIAYVREELYLASQFLADPTSRRRVLLVRRHVLGAVSVPAQADTDQHPGVGGRRTGRANLSISPAKLVPLATSTGLTTAKPSTVSFRH